MNRNKGLIITLCIMCLSAAVLWAIVRLFPATLVYILCAWLSGLRICAVRMGNCSRSKTLSSEK